MSNKVIPSTISIEDLLKELENSKEPEPTVEKEIKKRIGEDSLLKFLTEFNIEPGSNRVDRKIIYKLYEQYTSHPLSEKRFYREIKTYLTTSDGKYMKYRKFLHINQRSLDLSERVINYLKPKSRPRTKMIPMQMHFQNFVNKFNLKIGKAPKSIWVSVTTLYDLYDEWVYDIRKKRPLGIKEFSNFCKLYFPTTKRIHTKVWVSLDDSIKQLIEARTSFQNEQRKKTEEVILSIRALNLS